MEKYDLQLLNKVRGNRLRNGKKEMQIMRKKKNTNQRGVNRKQMMLRTKETQVRDI